MGREKGLIRLLRTSMALGALPQTPRFAAFHQQHGKECGSSWADAESPHASADGLGVP